MAMPTLAPVAADVYQQLRLLAPNDGALGWPFANFIAAKMAPIEEIAAWVRDTDDGPGYSILLDIDRAPAKALTLPAQLKGVVIPEGLTEAEQRAWVHTAEGQHRGMVDALILAGQRHLTGTKTIRVIERASGNAYNLTCITRTSETPTPSVTLADLMAAKRIGIVLTHVVADTPLIDEGTRTIDAVAAGVTIDSATLAQI